MSKKDIASYNFEELKEEMLKLGEKPFRSKQIYSWIHEKLVDSFDEIMVDEYQDTNEIQEEILTKGRGPVGIYRPFKHTLEKY